MQNNEKNAQLETSCKCIPERAWSSSNGTSTSCLLPRSNSLRKKKARTPLPFSWLLHQEKRITLGRARKQIMSPNTTRNYSIFLNVGTPSVSTYEIINLESIRCSETALCPEAKKNGTRLRIMLPRACFRPFLGCGNAVCKSPGGVLRGRRATGGPEGVRAEQ